MTEENVGEGQKGVDESGEESKDKHPETVPWEKYVGIKEKFTRVETELKGKVSDLEEQVKKAVSAEEHTKITEELKTTKTELEKVSGELKTTQEKTLSEKRDVLIKRGVPEEKVKELSEVELDNISAVLANVKPKPDLSGGGGGETPEKAKAKIQSGFENLHPSK